MAASDRARRVSAWRRAIFDGAASARYVIVPPDIAKQLPRPIDVPSNIRADQAVLASFAFALKELMPSERD